jgi:tetratricopeptide (TPR) repeat protein
MSQAETAASGSSAESATITTLVGDLALAAGEPADALAAYERAAARQPPRSLTELGMARALTALDRTDEAIAVLETSIARFPEPALLTLLGELYEATGRTGEASQIYAQTASLIDRHGAAGEDNSLEAARFHADHADPEDALRFAEIAYRNRPTVFAADVLAWSLTRAGRADEALAYVELANRLETDAVDIHVHTAAAYAAMGRTTEARDALWKAFTGVPYPFPELPPVAIDLANQLGLPIPPPWAGT